MATWFAHISNVLIGYREVEVYTLGEVSMVKTKTRTRTKTKKIYPKDEPTLVALRVAAHDFVRAYQESTGFGFTDALLEADRVLQAAAIEFGKHVQQQVDREEDAAASASPAARQASQAITPWNASAPEVSSVKDVRALRPCEVCKALDKDLVVIESASRGKPGRYAHGYCYATTRGMEAFEALSYDELSKVTLSEILALGFKGTAGGVAFRRILDRAQKA